MEFSLKQFFTRRCWFEAVLSAASGFANCKFSGVRWRRVICLSVDAKWDSLPRRLKLPGNPIGFDSRLLYRLFNHTYIYLVQRFNVVAPIQRIGASLASGVEFSAYQPQIPLRRSILTLHSPPWFRRGGTSYTCTNSPPDNWMAGQADAKPGDTATSVPNPRYKFSRW